MISAAKTCKNIKKYLKFKNEVKKFLGDFNREL